ncbi:3-dehydroquinate synthase [Ruficoccus amylovorans]|uniref:3-dehydroquinate synthase n=1 Tax=Ruficoccus amylovorans TaxID=1804625 RepID=A0A842HLQ7_9BACT|nr:3-dehydroquinate synthase [Ruficoccus amylovorans]MBC2596456.1 3-dehydroquinate synthase [Ruficoccus amylovorans]
MSDKLTVELGERSYPIIIASTRQEYREAIRSTEAWTAGAAVIFDENTRQYLPDGMPEEIVYIGFEPGEQTKCFASLHRIMDEMAAGRIDRGGRVIALGGGVIGDLAGYAAASYLRGVDFYQVPTTLLAMVDSSVGGKTGINIAAGKNLVGAFWQPQAVFICTELLKTLPPREFAAGMAEVIKYGMLYDRALFDQLAGLEQPLAWDHPALTGIIRRCCEIKAEIVKADEKETAASGGRALLNLGHTFAHAIENVAGYGTYLHGEAVAIGLVLAAELSARLTDDGAIGFDFDRADAEAVRKLVAANALPTSLKDPLGGQPAPALDIDKLMDAMRRDKKVRSGRLRFVAMEEIGRAVTVADVPEAWIRELWQQSAQ